MDAALLEQLLYEDESGSLDFKREQYKFAKATDEDKSELLKDILGFANGWRRADAYILIGVEHKRGSRSDVVGISEHLDDHALQQFVNNLTNRPVRFGYEACALDGKQVGVIRIEQQSRPIYLKKSYGKLDQGKVYVRRGSSTDPTKPATPDEIALMGAAASASQDAELAVEFADADREIVIGTHLEWSAEYCKMPTMKDIPNLSRPPRYNPLGIDFDALEGITGKVLNPGYYRERANYEFFKRLLRRTRLVVTNTGKVAANNVRVEVVIPQGERIGVFDESQSPDPPKRKHSRMQVVQSSIKNMRPISRHAGAVEIDTDDDRFKMEIDCKNIQPGRKIWSDTFYLGVGETGEFTFNGTAFAENLSEPSKFALSIVANIAQTSMTVDDLVALSEQNEDDQDSDEDED